jgi:hypothetical protein
VAIRWPGLAAGRAASVCQGRTARVQPTRHGDQHRRFEKTLTHEPPSARTQCELNRYFGFALSGARQQQVDDTDAGERTSAHEAAKRARSVLRVSPRR